MIDNTTTNQHLHRCLPQFSWASLYTFIVAIGTLSLMLFPHNAQAQTATDPFSCYNCIDANVDFWKKVYAEYPSTSGLIHDSANLAVIYEVISVMSTDEAGSRSYNKKKIDRVKKKYSTILNHLATNKKPTTAEEKRVAALFGANGSPDVWKTAANNIRFQTCLSDRFKTGVIRSGRYLEEIKSIFRDNGLPTDLAYLPHVESSFNYEAYSKFGAAGIWQFIHATGKRFLTISYTVDERRDPIAASHAAAKYLKENYGKLQNWPLAITAYNHGAASMQKAQNQLGDYESIFASYENKRFGFASKNFYSEFLAAREIAKNYRTYFPDITMDQPVQTHKVLMKQFAPMDLLAAHFKVSIDTIKELNPALRKPVYSGQKYIPKGYTLKLPVHLKNFDRLAQTLPDTIYEKEQKRSRFYQVARGDTAGGIARMHRIPLRDLIDINMLNRRATIYVGQNLRIPAPGEKIELATASPPAQAPPPSTPPLLAVAQIDTHSTITPLAKVERSTKKTKTIEAPQRQSSAPTNPKVAIQEAPATAKTAHKAPPAASETPVTASNDQLIEPPVNVAVDQTIPEIRAYEHPAEAEMEIPAVDPPASSVTEVNPAVISGNFLVEKIDTVAGHTIGYVQIEDMETLGHYADWLEIPTQALRKLNGLRFGRTIRTNQRIKIPLDKVSKELFEERRYEFRKEIEEDFFSAYKVVGIQAYSVKRGDNIWTLCRDTLELPFWLIKKYNPSLNVEALKLDQQITVPLTTTL